jgi:hypothetical protein
VLLFAHDFSHASLAEVLESLLRTLQTLVSGGDIVGGR